VVYPCTTDALGSAVEAANDGLIIPVLFGSEQEINTVAEKASLDRTKQESRSLRMSGTTTTRSIMGRL
jgi:hypothetical protein